MLSKLSHLSVLSTLRTKLAAIVAVAALVITMGGSWMTASSASAAPATPLVGSAPATSTTAAAVPGAAKKSTHKDLAGKINLNTANEDQLMLLPTVGPSKAERVVAWRKKNGGFKRTEDLRHVKGFGYKTWKRLAPFLDIKGDTTLAAK